MAHRRMHDPRFRQTQLDGVYAEHIAPINRLVDRLRDTAGGGWMPHVAPIYGGVNARILQVMRDPGPKTNSEVGFAGSGFLCLENDDATAERLATLLDEVNLQASDCVAWNAYPWYINAPPNAEQLEAGVQPLVELLTLLPRLQVVMLLGNHAQSSWGRLGKREPDVARRYRVIETRHTGHMAFIGTPKQKARWRADQLAAFREAAAILRGEEPPTGVSSEAEVVGAFTAWLASQGWDVQLEVDHIDVLATRNGERLVAEAKGRTTSAGLDVDTMYGQLLRRMSYGQAEDPVRYAVVVPEEIAPAALRVPREIRERLSIDVYAVSEDASVRQVR